jgi:hypothetical protein
MILRALEDGVQPPVAAQPGERAFDDPADAGWDEPSAAAAGNCLDSDAERLFGFRKALAAIAEITKRQTLEAAIGERALTRHDAFGVMPIRRRDIDRQRDAVFVDRNMDFDALDLLSAVYTVVKQLGGKRQDRRLMTTTLGSGESPQARRQSRRSRSSIRRQRPSRVQRANSP